MQPVYDAAAVVPGPDVYNPELDFEKGIKFSKEEGTFTDEFIKVAGRSPGPNAIPVGAPPPAKFGRFVSKEPRNWIDEEFIKARGKPGYVATTHDPQFLLLSYHTTIHLTDSIPSHPIPSHPIPSHPNLSPPNLSHPIPA